MAVERACWAMPDALDGVELAGFAKRIEELGYSRLWVAETLGRDPFALAAHLGAVTSTLGLASGIANVYNRHAGVMKQGACTVAEQTGGRFTLGLGVSSPVIVSKIRGIPYDKPLSFMRSYLDAMDAARYTSVQPPVPVPVVLAALGPRMLELAAERTDGAHPYNTTPEHTAFARSVMGPDAQLCVEQKVMLTSDAEQARATGGKVMKFYTRAPGYRRCWKRLGFDDDDIDGLSDRFVDAMVAWGDVDAIERRLAEHADAGATQVCIQVLHPESGAGAVDYGALARPSAVKDLAGRVAVVTGGASGMGRGMAERFAAESMRVVVADIEEPPLHETVQSIRDAGAEAVAVVCDVSSWPSVEALRDACTAAFGPADVLCNNAGVAATGGVAELSLKSWEWCLGVNLWGVIHGCRAFLPSMIERGSGHVVNTASVLGHITSAGIGPYNVSKHGVVALSETLHAEMLAEGTGVGVTCLCPGLVSTNILDSERNRPEHLQDQPGVMGLWDSDAVAGSAESETRAAIRDLYAQALRPSAVADMVVRAIRAGELWLFTDPDFDDAIAARHRDIEARRTPDSPASLGSALLEDHSP